MKERLLTALAKSDARLVYGAMALLVALIAFEAWHLVLRSPLAQYQQLRQSRAGLAAVVAASPRQPAELTRLAANVQALSDRLKAELRVAQSDEQLTAQLMTELDRSATRAGAALKAVKPGTLKALGAFEELSFDVVAEGKYLTLCGWLLDLERLLGPSAALAEFSMKATETRQAAVTLKLALYRGRSRPQVN